MAGPLTLKASSYPATAATMEGLRELSTAEIRDYIAYAITSDFVSVHGSNTAQLTVTTSSLGAGFTSIGTFTDRVRDDSVGTHPTTASTSTTQYNAGQYTTAGTEDHSLRPLRWNGTDVVEMTDTEIDEELMDEVITAMVLEDDSVVGQYKIGTTVPSGGTWTSRGSFVDTQTDGTTVTYNLYQKTGATTAPSTSRDGPCCFDGDSVRAMTETEIKVFKETFANRIIDSGVGTYLLQTGTPTETGTWTQMGSTMTDQLKDTATYAYAGDYTGSYTGYYDRYYGGFLNGAYAGSYSGTYTGYYDGLTIISTGSTQETKQLFIRTA